MKKVHIRNYILLIFASIFLVGCSLEKSEGESVVQQPVELVIRASQGGATRAMDNVDDVIEVGAELAPAADTRTELGPVVNGKQQIYWSTSETTTDKIRVWAKNSADSYSALNGVEFWLKSYNYDYNTADFTNAPTTRVEKMPSGTYTYYGLYPSPEAVSGTTATFTLPTTQSGGYDGSLDWMWATATGPELIYRPEMNSNSTLPPQPHLDFQHLLHLMRISVPTNLLGRDVKRLEITFPQAVVGGTATVDVKTGAITWDGQQSNKLTIDLADGNLLNVGGYVWAHLCSGVDLDGTISFQVYDDYGVPTQALSTTIDKTLSAGHITPVNLTIPRSKYDDVTYIEIEETANNLGEAWNTMTLSGYTFVKPFTLDTTNSNVVTPNDTKKYKVAIVATASSLQNGAIAASYDSPNAIVNNSIKLPQTISNNLVEVDNQVPYLLFEDFSRIVIEEESYGNNTYDSSDRNQPGQSLSQLPGWSAARYWAKQGAFRLNVRWQMVKILLSFTSTHYGRLDSVPLSALKSSANVKLKVQFDAGANVHSSSNNGAKQGSHTYISLATHTNSSNPINGVGIGTAQDGSLSDFGTTYYTSNAMASLYGADDFQNTYPTHTVEIGSATKATRLCFYPSTTFSTEGITKAEFNVYLDNIRVSIAN